MDFSPTPTKNASLSANRTNGNIEAGSIHTDFGNELALAAKSCLAAWYATCLDYWTAVVRSDPASYQRGVQANRHTPTKFFSAQMTA